MRVVILSVLLLFSSLVWAKESINVGVTQWQGYTNVDGTGVYNELLKTVYEDYDLALKFDSYTRNVRFFEQGKLDVIVGVFREDISKGYFPRWHLDMEYPVTAFFNKYNLQITSPLDFENMVISWLRGYNFEKYIDVKHKTYLLNSTQMGFNLAAKGRIDVFVDYEYNMPQEYRKIMAGLEILGKRKVYLAFANTTKGLDLAQHFDKKMLALRDSGALAKIYNAEDNGYNHAEFESFKPSRPNVIVRTRDVSLLKGGAVEAFDSLEGKLLKTLFGRIRDFDIETAKYDSFTSDVEDYAASKNTCIANKAKNMTREQHFMFSDPFVMYPGLRLYSKKPLNMVGDNISLAALFAQSPELKLGHVLGQFYSDDINAALSEVSANNIVLAEPDILSQLRLLDAEEIDVTIEYPSVISEFWPYVNDTPLYSYPLQGATQRTLGHLMCSKSTVNETFLKAFNRALALFKKEKLFYEMHQTGAKDIDQATFNKLFEESFLSH